MNDETPQLDPADFGRRAAEAFVPIFEESFRRIMGEWSDEFRASAPQTPAQPTPEWRGGTPSEAQLKAMTDNASDSKMDRLLASVDEIKSAVGTLASNGGQA